MHTKGGQGVKKKDRCKEAQVKFQPPGEQRTWMNAQKREQADTEEKKNIKRVTRKRNASNTPAHRRDFDSDGDDSF